jgi:anaerobic selenocysteine-containing dehydrogenase
VADVINSFCARLCSGTCGILVTRNGQTITEVRGDPDCEFNRGYICPKGRALPELLYHPDRLKYPLKRIGQKGEDKWQPISKDEALDTIATKLEKSVEEFGPESTLFYAGAYRGLERDFIQRFASVLGTPNTVSVDNNCHNEKLYDTDFVGEWTVGFDRLKDFIAAYPLDQVAEKTWVPQSLIEQAARMFAAARPAAIQWGNALDQTSNAFQTCRAVAILMAITGNLDVPGGAIFPEGVPLLSGADFSLAGEIAPNRKAGVGNQFKLAARANIVPSQEAAKAILEFEIYL